MPSSRPIPLHPSWHSSRRELLTAGVTGIGMAVLGGSACAAPRSVRAGAPGTGDDDLLDQAYERLHARQPDVSVHRSNHVPMVAEALCVLGRADAIAGWLDGNLERFERWQGPSVPIEPEHWRELLGQHARFHDWRTFFGQELAGGDWRAVVRLWVPRFVPGLAGAATHGLIRTGHAVRALVARDNAIRRLELATGLAYWAVNHEELPWDGTVAPEKSIAAALSRVQPRQPALAPPRGNIVSGLRALGATPSFGPVAGLVDTSDPARTLSEISAAFARLYLANPEQRIAFTHSLTAPSALRLLSPELDEESLRTATRYAWQAAAGIYVVYGDPRRAAPAGSAPEEPSATITRALATGGAHAIKLTEACLREDALAHDPALLAAARDAAGALSG